MVKWFGDCDDEQSVDMTTTIYSSNFLSAVKNLMSDGLHEKVVKKVSSWKVQRRATGNQVSFKGEFDKVTKLLGEMR